MHTVEQAIANFYAALPSEKTVAVGFSGGLDSTVLAHALKHLAALTGLADQSRLHLLHVDHQLHEHSAAWACHCEQFANELGLPFSLLRVQVERAGRGLEDAARRARYQAIAAAMPDNGVLVTAHHQQDQAETVLLRILSGAGPRGASGMRQQTTLFGINLLRPLLSVPKADLMRYAKAHQLHWVEDPSNQDRTFARNRVRQLMVQIQAEFPNASMTLANFAQHAQADQSLLEQHARVALASIRESQAARSALDKSESQAARSASDKSESQAARSALDKSESQAAQSLDVNKLNAHPPTAQMWIVRAWLSEFGVHSPELTSASVRLSMQDADHGQVSFNLDAHRQAWVRRFRQHLYFARETIGDGLLPEPISWQINASSGSRQLHLPNALGSLRFESTSADPSANIGHPRETFIVRQRTGGERIQLPGRSHTHALKDVLQNSKLAPWERERALLLHFKDTNELACVLARTALNTLLSRSIIVKSARFEQFLANYQLRLVPNHCTT
jgi:tRNA(Ile)-lysidine synthase